MCVVTGTKYYVFCGMLITQGEVPVVYGLSITFKEAVVAASKDDAPDILKVAYQDYLARVKARKEFKPTSDYTADEIARENLEAERGKAFMRLKELAEKILKPDSA